MKNLIDKALSLGVGALAMTRDKATEVVDELVQKGEVKREEARTLIDKLEARGEEKRTELHKTLSTQVTALNARADAIRTNLSTGTEESREKARQELDRLGEQITEVQSRLSKSRAQVEESTRRTLEQAGKHLAVAQTHLTQATEKIQDGAIEGAQHGVEALRTALDKANHVLRGD